MKPITILLPLDLSKLTQNFLNGKHWRTTHALRAEAQNVTGWAWVQAGRPVADGPVDVSVVIRKSGRRFDEDNAISALKSVFDGLFKQRITPDDGPRWVRLVGVRQETGPSYRWRPEAEITITPRAAAAESEAA